MSVIILWTAPYNDSFVRILLAVRIVINKSIVKVTCYTGLVFSLAWVIGTYKYCPSRASVVSINCTITLRIIIQPSSRSITGKFINHSAFTSRHILICNKFLNLDYRFHPLFSHNETTSSNN